MHSHQRGMTLVELLAGLAILGLLLALLTSILGNVRRQADATACLANLRTMGQAVHVYAVDHDGDLPATMHDGLQNSWLWLALEQFYGTLSNKARNAAIIRHFRSPVDPNPDRQWSYAINDYLTNATATTPGGNPLPWTTLATIPQPEGTFLASVCARDYTGQDHFHFAIDGAGPKPFAANVEAELFQGAGHYLFVDGHVERRSWADVSANLANPIPFVQPGPMPE